MYECYVSASLPEFDIIFDNNSSELYEMKSPVGFKIFIFIY